jgi:hypothetical protein
MRACDWSCSSLPWPYRVPRTRAPWPRLGRAHLWGSSLPENGSSSVCLAAPCAPTAEAGERRDAASPAAPAAASSSPELDPSETAAFEDCPLSVRLGATCAPTAGARKRRSAASPAAPAAASSLLSPELDPSETAAFEDCPAESSFFFRGILLHTSTGVVRNCRQVGAARPRQLVLPLLRRRTRRTVLVDCYATAPCLGGHAAGAPHCRKREPAVWVRE